MPYYEVTYYKLIDKERVTYRNIFKANSFEKIKKYLVDDKTVVEIGKCEYRNTIHDNEYVIDIEFEKYKKRYNELEDELCDVLDVQRYHEQVISSKQKVIDSNSEYTEMLCTELSKLRASNDDLLDYNQELNDKLRLEKDRVHWFELMLGTMLGISLAVAFLL